MSTKTSPRRVARETTRRLIRSAQVDRCADLLADLHAQLERQAADR